MMIKTLALTGLLGLAPLAAMAGDASRAAPQSMGFKSIGEIESQLKADGFQIADLERNRRTYEVTGREKSGRCVELRLDGKSGKVLNRERDDDCGYDDDRYDSDDRYSDDHAGRRARP